MLKKEEEGHGRHRTNPRRNPLYGPTREVHREAMVTTQRTPSTSSTLRRNLTKTVPQQLGESGSTANAGMFAREVTVTDRRFHLPTAALVIAEEAQMLSEYHQIVAEQAHVVRETEMRHRQQILSEAHELEHCLRQVKQWTDRH